MDANPYSPPRTGASTPPGPILRKRWVAVLLALLIAPIAMLYLVRPRRAGVYLLGSAGVLALSLVWRPQGWGGAAAAAVIGSLAVPLVAAIDAYRLAGPWPGLRLPWYARPLALVSFTLVPYLALLACRAFLVEPLKIPAGSMEPTLRIGDYVLADKRSYASTIPFTRRRIVRMGSPQRGDVAVFRYPPDDSLDYVKRVVGVPGDIVTYRDKRLIINGLALPTTPDGFATVIQLSGRTDLLEQYRETLDGKAHAILIDPNRPALVQGGLRDFPGHEACRYGAAGFECTVPPGNYFVMGDNRDHSSDSRYWGFVPEDHFIGRVTFVWHSSQHPGRAGTAVE